jgi:hypothetical protein
MAARAAAAPTPGTATAGAASRTGLAQSNPAAANHRVGAAGAAGSDRPTTEVDAEGFQVVHRRGWRKGRADASQGDDDAGDATTHQAAAELGATTSEDQAGGGNGDGANDGDGGEAPSPGMLHQEWHDEIALVKRLKQQGIADDHPAMRAACSARDAAEQRWRKAKDPTPASVRLSRAQSKLDKAVNMQAETRRALLELEKEYKERQAVLQAKLDEDTARVRNRRQQLDDVQDELTSEGRGGRARAEQGAAVRKVHGALCNEVAPTIATLIEQLDSATPAWAMLNGLLSTLTTSKTLLEKKPSRPRGPRRSLLPTMLMTLMTRPVVDAMTTWGPNGPRATKLWMAVVMLVKMVVMVVMIALMRMTTWEWTRTTGGRTRTTSGSAPCAGNPQAMASGHGPAGRIAGNRNMARRTMAGSSHLQLDAGSMTDPARQWAPRPPLPQPQWREGPRTQNRGYDSTGSVWISSSRMRLMRASSQ